MSENLTSDTTDAPPEVPTQQQIESLVSWYQTFFMELADCCRSKGIPKPPHW